MKRLFCIPKNVAITGSDGKASSTREYLDVRRGAKKSNANLILEYLEKYKDRVFFSKDIADILIVHAAKTRDVVTSEGST